MDKEKLRSRINKILNNPEFKLHCYRLRKNPHFLSNKNIYEKIARLNINCNGLFPQQDLTISEDIILQDALDFFKQIDMLTPNQIEIAPIAQKNANFYLTYEEEGFSRSCCAKIGDGEGGFDPIIYINMKSLINTRIVMAHELCHSIAPSFLGSRHIDERMTEVSTLIVDKIFSDYLKTIYPEYIPILEKEELYHLSQNVSKAKNALLESCIVEVVTGSLSMQSAMVKYGSLFSLEEIEEQVEAIEKCKFQNIYEGRYVIADAIAQNFYKDYKSNNAKKLNQFKKVLLSENEITLENAIKQFELPTLSLCVNNFAYQITNTLNPQNEIKTKILSS